MRPTRFLLALLSLLSTGIAARATAPAAPSDHSVENLAAFARVYGYVRFFHPSDQAVAVDWDKFALLGAEAVREAKNPDELRLALLRTFQPVAPSLRLTENLADTAAATTAPTPGGQLTFWQHLGINLTDKPNLYRQQRVITGETKGPRAPLFEPATAPAPLVKAIAPNLVLILPLALPVDAEGKTAAAGPEFAALQSWLAALELTKATPADWRVRVAGIVTIWSTFQHFHPYLDGIGVKWDEALAPAIRRTLRDATGDDYYETLMELIARTQDGHGYIYGRKGDMGGIPIRIALVENQVVVTAVAENAPFHKGDIVERIDGGPALDLLHDRERYTSGSPQLRRFRALNQFGQGTPGSVAHVELKRDGRVETIDFTRTKERRGYFFNGIAEFTQPAFAEVRPGIFYVNLYALDQPSLTAQLDRLAGARGVIFDWRWGGRTVAEDAKMIQPEADIIPHLIDQPIQASPMMIPQITEPDRAGWTYKTSTWPVTPKAPRFKGRIVFINEPSVVSYGETCMAMLADYHLVTLVGEPTAGCNGNVNFINLPDGLRVMWTGMDVRRHDHSPFYTIGFPPDVPVTRTIKAVQEGRDEFLEQAIATIESTAATASP
jgi:hypothetical protein